MTREERIEELKKLIDLEEEELKKKIVDTLQPYISMPIGIRLNRTAYDKRLYFNVSILDKEGNSIFATGIDVYFDERYKWKDNKKIEYIDSYKMGINYGSCGTHTQDDSDGALKQSDIMIGKLWEKEEEITNIYKTINWSNIKEHYQLLTEIRLEEEAKLKAEREEKARQEKIELDEVLNKLYVGQILKENDNQFNGIIRIEKIGRKNILLNHDINLHGRWTKYLDKYTFAKYLLANDFKIKED